MGERVCEGVNAARMAGALQNFTRIIEEEPLYLFIGDFPANDQVESVNYSDGTVMCHRFCLKPRTQQMPEITRRRLTALESVTVTQDRLSCFSFI